MIEKLGNEYGQEFWYARELQYALEYASWRNLKEYKIKRKRLATTAKPVLMTILPKWAKWLRRELHQNQLKIMNFLVMHAI